MRSESFELSCTKAGKMKGVRNEKSCLEGRVRLTLLSSLDRDTGRRQVALIRQTDSTTTSPAQSECGSNKWAIFRENNCLVRIVVGEHLSRRTPEGTKK